MMKDHNKRVLIGFLMSSSLQGHLLMTVSPLTASSLTDLT